MFFNHPPNYSNVLAVILLKTYHTKICNSIAFVDHPPQLRNVTCEWPPTEMSIEPYSKTNRLIFVVIIEDRGSVPWTGESYGGKKVRPLFIPAWPTSSSNCLLSSNCYKNYQSVEVRKLLL